MSSIIYADNLSKSYTVLHKKPGISSSIKSLFSPEYVQKHAIKNLNFSIETGEVVGILGPNGAGKTTTMKMLAGILHASSGTCKVLGYTPWERDKSFRKRIAMIMGQKNSLWWDLPASDSFLLNKEIYDVSDKDFVKVVGEMSEILGVVHLLNTPIRNLSLGERMKMEIISGFLHNPEVVFLDEPSIGLDIPSQRAIRDFIKTINSLRNTTLLITSHYMADIEELCKRVIIIHDGSILYDGSLKDISSNFSDQKKISLVLQSEVPVEILSEIGTVTEKEDVRVSLEVNKNNLNQALEKIGRLPVVDLNIQEIPVEKVIDEIFTLGKVRG
ncbi:ATP-binding cassette domain-containing protein [Paenibacillus sp. NPDC057934]|uniref:ABC transporter ATP-binding protein n=1 Tax=Paenibacillus sp. NPDC057934 TaxID=3346282 RepID=UPI0036D9DFA1